MKLADVFLNMKVGFTNDNITYTGKVIDTKPVTDEGSMFLKVKLDDPDSTVLAPIDSLLGLLVSD